MIFLILILSCTFKGLRIKEKGKREELRKYREEMRKDINILIQEEYEIQQEDEYEPDSIIDLIEDLVCKWMTLYYKDERGVLPVEKAIEVGNLELVDCLINIEEFDYPERVYKKIIDTESVEMFNLIPEKCLDYRILSMINEIGNRELENEFMKRIEATELERLIVEGKNSEIDFHIDFELKNKILNMFMVKSFDIGLKKIANAFEKRAIDLFDGI